MNNSIKNIQDYILNIPENRRKTFETLWNTIIKNLPEGFSEDFLYGMPGVVVPKSIYPNGYHCNPDQPLPFINLANQKNYIAFYHMGLYLDKELFDWFTREYSKISKSKLDIGKSCIRFKKVDEIPLNLIARLIQKMDVKSYINLYESSIHNRRKK